MVNGSDELLEAALRYAELGYLVFPTVPNTPGQRGKNPLTDRGFLEATNDAAQIAEWWKRWPNANVAIRTEGLVVIDCDPGSTWLADFPELAGDLLAAPQATTPRGGTHRVFRQPPGKAWRNTTSTLAHKVDTRANGGYILVEPSRIDDSPYRWADGAELDCGPEKLPYPPAWLSAELDRVGRGVGNLNRRGEDECDPDGAIAEGSRNGTLTRLAGMMRRGGMHRPEIEAALLSVNINRCSPPLPVGEVKRVAWSVSRYSPDQITVAVMEGHYEADRGEVEPEKAVTPIVEPQLPSELLNVGGLIGMVASYTESTCHKSQPDLAFAGALSLMAVLTGRKIADEQDTRTNIYSFGLAPSGGGKDRARQVNKEILMLANGLHLLGQESFASSQGLFTQVETRGVVLCQVDELGEFLRSVRNPKSTHLAGIIAELLKLYSSANSVYRGPAHADASRDKSVNQPHLVFYGTTVAESFFDAMTTESVTGGFLPRAFFFEGPAKRPPTIESRKFPVPVEIIEEVKAWIGFEPGGNLSSESPRPKVVPVSGEAAEVFRQAARDADARQDLLGFPLDTIWTRVVENARKLALLHACSLKGPAVERVEKESAEWAVAVATNRAARMEHLAESRVAENEYDSLRKRLLKIVEDAGADGVSGRQWYAKTRMIPPSRLKEALGAIVAAGEIVIESTATKGRPGVVYRSRRHMRQFNLSHFVVSGNTPKSGGENTAKSA